jgi:V8-like Glu-specific endopeptidase
MARDNAHFLDESSYDWTRAEAVELHRLLTRAYATKPRVDLLVAQSGIDRGELNTDQSIRGLWKQVLEVAAASARVRQLVERARADTTIASYHPLLDRLLGASPAVPEAPAPSTTAISWQGNEIITGHQETFLEMSFLHKGLRAATSVAHLRTVTRGDRCYRGTGFLVAPDTILTNYHVLHDLRVDGSPVKQVDIWFNHEQDETGRPRLVDPYEGDVETIAGDTEHDWAILRSLTPVKKEYEMLSIRPSRPVSVSDFVYIIQHPEGRTKKIGLLHNQVVHVTRDRVQYLTDTLPGSSGAPVFNDEWQVVALHHRGIEGDVSRGEPGRNQGIHIDRVVEGLRARGVLPLR